MDALAGFLDGPRARGAFLLRVLVEPPWSLRVQDEAPLTLIGVIRGTAWATPEHGDPRRLGAGDVAIFRGPAPYTLADDPTTSPRTIIHPGQRCATTDGRDLATAMSLGVRTWGDGPDSSTMLLVGTYEKAGEVSRRLLDALPPLVVLTHADWGSPLFPLLAEEAVKDEPGQETVLDRLLDLLVVDGLRTWFTRQENAAPAWYRANQDPVVGRALKLLQNNPAHPWTIERLAAEVGASRAALARRFKELVGESPMAFLTDVRLALAADLLQDPDATLAGVAHKVGYSTPFALSTAFKRVRGISPREHRLATPS